MKYYCLLFVIIFIKLIYPIHDNSIHRSIDVGNYFQNRCIYEKDTSVSDTSFQYFWETFRKSVLSKDSVSLIEMINIPLLAVGYQDSDPQYNVYEDNFIKYLDVFLGFADFHLYDKNQFDKYKRNLPYITSTFDVATCGFCVKTKTWIRMGDMEFILINNQWKLSKLYMDTNFINGIK